MGIFVGVPPVATKMFLVLYFLVDPSAIVISTVVGSMTLPKPSASQHRNEVRVVLNGRFAAGLLEMGDTVVIRCSRIRMCCNVLNFGSSRIFLGASL